MRDIYDSIQGLLDFWPVEIVHPNSQGWRSQGTVFKETPQGSIVLIKRLEGATFQTKEAAKAHALEISKKWVDENLKPIENVDS
jgi:hypothetical protein